MAKVLVTGATGFIGLHCVKQLLDDGHSVRGTVRSSARRGEVIGALKKADTNTDGLEIVEADLLADAGWAQAVAGCDYVLHVASPFVTTVPKDENELIRPAVEGTMRVLKAAAAAGVKKTVLTSSVAAIADTFDGKTDFSEDDWSDAANPKIAAYNKSKTLAERAAWDFMKSGGGEMKLTVINPAGVIGPTLSADIGTSNSFVKRLIDGSMPGCPPIHLGFVDVREVARAHIAAMTNPRSDGERFIISEREFWVHEIAALLREAGFTKAPARRLPAWLIKVFSWFDKQMGVLVPMLGSERRASAAKAREILNWQPRNAGDALVETARQLEKMGLA